MFDRNIKENTFTEGEMVLRWDARKEQKGKHGKFENLWFGPFLVSKVLENNNLSCSPWKVRSCPALLMGDSSSISTVYKSIFTCHCTYRCE